MELQDLKDIYKSKTAEKRYDYYRTLPLDEKDLFGDTLLDNATGGLINLRSYAGRHVSNPTDFNRGLAAGDAASVGIGTGKAVLVLE